MSWWRGSRGEWLVVAQVILMVLVIFGPREAMDRSAWPAWLLRALPIVGGVLMAAGGTLLVAAIPRLGRGLTPLPYPKDGADLVQTGPYALVRHPMYAGGLIFCIGWELIVLGWLTLAYVCALFVLIDVKSRREEQWLTEKFPTYPAYRRRVRKLIPYIY